MLFVSFFLQRNRMRHVFLAPSLRVAAPSPWQRKNGEMRKCGGECGYTLATSPQSSRGRFRLALKCSPNSHKWTCWQASLSLFFLSQEPFDQFGTSLMTMFVMTLGELNYSDNFLDKELSFSTLANVLFIVLVLGMPIIMMNMLVSSHGISEFTQQDQEEEDRKTLVSDKGYMAITCRFCRGLPLKLMLSGLLRKDLFKGRWSLAARFSNKLIVTLVTQGLPSPFLSRPVGGGKGGGEIACDGGVRANREGGFSLPSLYPLFASLFPLYPRNFYKTRS